jgi:hypothetical protein
MHPGNDRAPPHCPMTTAIVIAMFCQADPVLLVELNFEKQEPAGIHGGPKASQPLPGLKCQMRVEHIVSGAIVD